MTLGLSIIILIASQHAFADTCSARLTSYNAPQFYLLSDGVFAGTVQHIDNTTDHQWKVYFTVDKLWRGSISQKPLMVMTNSLQGCGYSIVQGEKYLVYTNGYPPFFNTVWSKPYADAQSDIAIMDDPKFQSDEKAQEELNKKLVIARDAISNLMGSKMGNIPFNSVGVDVINSTLDIGIDSAKAVLSEEEYEKKIKDIVGDIPIKITFGQNFATAPIIDTLSAKNSVSVPLPPLKQFKSGITASDVQCVQGLELVIKAEDNSPACVKFSTAESLIRHGWASSESGISSDGTRTYIIQDSSASSTPCDIPYPQSNTGIAVLYMPTNSTGKLCVDYSNPNSPKPVDVRIFDARHLSEDTKDIQVLPSQDSIPQGNSTIVYTLKTSRVGFYGLTLFCYGTPLAVGYDNQSRIVANDFPWLGQTFYCPMQSYTFHISGVSGMGVKYIPYP